MPDIRYKKVFPKDLTSYTVPKDLSKYTRIGIIDSVDPQAGTCSIRWLDALGIRANVQLTQGGAGEFNIPNRGDVALLGTDSKDQVHIIRYMNLGHESKVKVTKTLPKLKDGDKLWEVGGSFLWMKKNGDLVLSTSQNGYFVLENKTGTLKSETVNWKVTSEAGEAYFGLLKRPITNADGTQSFTVLRDSVTQKALTEYRLRVVETGDNSLGVSNLSTPLFDLTIGTVADSLGNTISTHPVTGMDIPIPSIDGLVSNPDVLCFEMTIRKPPLVPNVPGIQILKMAVSKSGVVNINALSVNVNSTMITINGVAPQPVARAGDPVSVTIPPGAISVPSTPYTNPLLTVTGTITSGSPTVLVGTGPAGV
jgi:hypothetical protein